MKLVSKIFLRPTAVFVIFCGVVIVFFSHDGTDKAEYSTAAKNAYAERVWKNHISNIEVEEILFADINYEDFECSVSIARFDAESAKKIADGSLDKLDQFEATPPENSFSPFKSCSLPNFQDDVDTAFQTQGSYFWKFAKGQCLDICYDLIVPSKRLAVRIDVSVPH